MQQHNQPIPNPKHTQILEYEQHITNQKYLLETPNWTGTIHKEDEHP